MKAEFLMSTLRESECVHMCNLKVFERAWISYPDFNELCLSEVLWVRVFKSNQWLHSPTLSPQITPIKM